MNRGMLNVVRKMSDILNRCLTTVCVVLFTFAACLQSLRAESCSQQNPSGTCQAGKMCLLNGSSYECYGSCGDQSFGFCPHNEVCLVSLTRISKDLKQNSIYACFTCTDSNPLGSCPAGQSCFTCNGSSKCVTDDFVCTKQTTNLVSGTNLEVTTRKSETIPVPTTMSVVQSR